MNYIYPKEENHFLIQLKYYQPTEIYLFERTDEEKNLIVLKILSIPLINGLSPNSHPAQILSDIFAIEEINKKIFLGWIFVDRDLNNILNSLIEASIKFHLNWILRPKNYNPPSEMLRMIRQKVQK